MAVYEYRCPEHGSFERGFADDRATCPVCHHPARRVWKLRINAESARHRGRFDPVVGQYVENDAQFRSLLRRGQDEQSAKLNMDVKLETLDARDNEGLAELHGHDLAERTEIQAVTKHVKDKERAK